MILRLWVRFERDKYYWIAAHIESNVTDGGYVFHKQAINQVSLLSRASVTNIVTYCPRPGDWSRVRPIDHHANGFIWSNSLVRNHKASFWPNIEKNSSHRVLSGKLKGISLWWRNSLKWYTRINGCRENILDLNLYQNWHYVGKKCMIV